MASISKQPNGRRTIQFVNADGKRRSIRLGKISQRNAEAVKHRIEQILAAQLTGHAIDGETARWIANLDAKLAAKLTRAGLIPKQLQQEATRLGPFLADYLDRRIDVKPGTKEVWGHTVRNLVDCFGPERDISTINDGHAEDFKMYLIALPLASTTVQKRLQFARMLFKAALKRRLIETNPFAEVNAKAVMSDDREYFVTQEETDTLLTVCNPTWRLIVALCRYGGMRCPSEVLSLEWQHVNFDTNRILVHAPKTEHHPGKGTRTIPLYSELRPFLMEAQETCPDGAIYVVGGGYRESSLTDKGWRNCNLRTQLERLIKRAGLHPWPKLFQSLRSSRETELIQRHPIHTVTRWMGNSPRIAMKHYLQVRDTDFDLAVKGAAESGAVALQKAVQHSHALNRTEAQELTKPPAEQGVYAAGCATVQDGANCQSGEDRIRTCGPVSRSRI